MRNFLASVFNPNKKRQIIAQIQQLQNRISNIQGTLSNMSNEMSRQG